MATKLSLLTGVIKNEVNDLTSDIFGSSSSDSKKENSGGSDVDPAKARKEEQKREEAQRQYEEERRKKREKAEYQREKVREGIRQKYGIEKKTNDKKTNPAAIEEVKKSYNMTEEEFAEFKEKVAADEDEKMKNAQKIDKKLEKRKAKKELKQTVKDSCKTQ